jgi:hypothetical protein
MSRQRFKPGKTPFSNIAGARWIDYPGFIETCHPTQHPKSPKGETGFTKSRSMASAASFTFGTARSWRTP